MLFGSFAHPYRLRMADDVLQDALNPEETNKHTMLPTLQETQDFSKQAQQHDQNRDAIEPVKHRMSQRSVRVRKGYQHWCMQMRKHRRSCPPRQVTASRSPATLK